MKGLAAWEIGASVALAQTSTEELKQREATSRFAVASLPSSTGVTAAKMIDQ